MRFPKTLALALSCLLPVSGLSAEELLGADIVLQRVAGGAGASPARVTDPVAQLRQQISSYRAEAASLAPDQAAARWLALADLYFRIPMEARFRQSHGDRVEFSTLLQALPPPESWDALAEAMTRRAENAKTAREHALGVLATILAGDIAKQTAAVERLREGVKKDRQIESYLAESLNEGVDRIADAVLARADDAARLAAFERSLVRMESVRGRAARSGSFLEVPDLLRFASREKAEALIVRALALDAELSLHGTGPATRRAFSELALKNVGKLKRPRWDLVSSLQDVALYEAMAKRFPGGGNEQQAAALVYVFGLIAADRGEEAVERVLSPDFRLGRRGSFLGYASRELFSDLRRAGRGDALVDFLGAVVQRDPSMPLWDLYTVAAAQQGRAAEVLGVLRTLEGRAGLDPRVAADLRERKVTALLAADLVDEGLASLRSLLAADLARPAEGADASSASPPPVADVIEPELAGYFGGSDSAPARAAERALSLVEIGRLMNKPDLVEEGMGAARALLPRLGERESYQRTRLLEAMVEHLVARGRAPEAEALLLGELLQLRDLEKGPHRHRTQQTLLGLAHFYARLDRHADVLRVFVASPDLGVADLSALPTHGVLKRRPSPHLDIADALAATGRPHEARAILRRMLDDAPGADAVYERLEKLGGSDHASWLESMARVHRFEERPLIWKARWQSSSGDLDGAERTIRAAIAIDPSDGEQGKGDRMRAYAVLGDILEKKGDAEQAAFMRGAVAAIRLSEQADDWWSAGLLTRAVRIYEESLLKFADAYCIQSRLALRYHELGDTAKAEEHYRRAFELMPDSFGRVESHCFGCEGAFEGEQAQNAADRVFTRLAVEQPDRAQVHYLLGYLRSSQSRYEEAAAGFRRAVARDPDYLNAWSKLLALAEATRLPAAEREEAALAILRLDPRGNHVSLDLENVVDLRRLWGALLEQERSLPPRETGPLFAFTASAEKLAAGDGNDRIRSFLSSRSRKELRAHIAENSLLREVSQFIEATSYR